MTVISLIITVSYYRHRYHNFSSYRVFRNETKRPDGRQNNSRAQSCHAALSIRLRQRIGFQRAFGIFILYKVHFDDF